MSLLSGRDIAQTSREIYVDACGCMDAATGVNIYSVMRRTRGIFGGLFLFGRNCCVDLFFCSLWAFVKDNHKSEPIRMRECSYSAALSMKSALRCKKNKCSAFSKHRLDKKWRMLLFGRISVCFTTGSSISTMFLSNLPSDNLRARAIAWKSFGGLVNFSAGLHLIDQLGKGSEKCSVCKPYAYSRALRLIPWLTLYSWCSTRKNEIHKQNT